MILLLICLIVIYFDTSIFTTNKCPTNMKDTTLSFNARIDVIFNTGMYSPYSPELLHVEEFKKIHKCPDLYKLDALEYLATKQEDIDKNLIVVYSMHELSLEDYIDFVYNCFEMFEKGRIEELVLQESIISVFDEAEYKIIKNYEEKKIKKLLLEIGNSQKISISFKNLLNNIVSGEVWKGIKQFKESGGTG